MVSKYTRYKQLIISGWKDLENWQSAYNYMIIIIMIWDYYQQDIHAAVIAWSLCLSYCSTLRYVVSVLLLCLIAIITTQLYGITSIDIRALIATIYIGCIQPRHHQASSSLYSMYAVPSCSRILHQELRERCWKKTFPWR